MDQGGRLLAGTVSAAPVPPPAALDGEGAPRQDLLPLILQQIQLYDSQAGQFSHLKTGQSFLKGRTDHRLGEEHFGPSTVDQGIVLLVEVDQGATPFLLYHKAEEILHLLAASARSLHI